jgi:hypothetical protein
MSLMRIRRLLSSQWFGLTTRQFRKVITRGDDCGRS